MTGSFRRDEAARQALRLLQNYLQSVRNEKQEFGLNGSAG